MRITPIVVILFLLCEIGVFAESQTPLPRSRINIQKKNESADQTTQKRTYKQPGTEEMPLVIKGFPAAESENDTAYKKYEQHEKPTLDRWLTWGTVALAIFTFFLFCFTAALWWVTYRLSKDARKTGEMQARDTQASLSIAKESADLARASFDSYRMAERAWVSFSGVDIGTVTNGRGVNGERVDGMVFTIKWLNSGHTPAIRCRLFSDGKAIYPPDKIPAFNESPSVTDRRETTLIPGVTVSGHRAFFPEADMVKLMENKCRIFLYGKTDYNIAFARETSESQYTEVCMEVEYVGLDGNTKERRFSFVPSGPQNSAT